tara:strand:+ start:12131 stop:12442 length:312 start_codon:yes stop_codon:yes gene_type:complete
MKLTKNNFKDTLEKNKVVLVDFWAEWCGPCRMLGPTIDELEKDYQDKAIVAKINTEEERELAVEFGIRSIPAILIFKDGVQVEQVMGVRPKSYYSDKIKYYLN